jgi:hypothetical protein
MPTVVNKTERLINTHDMTPIPPGVATEISDEALANATIAQAITDGFLENTSEPAGTRIGAKTEQPNQQQPNQQRTNPPNPNQSNPNKS